MPILALEAEAPELAAFPEIGPIWRPFLSLLFKIPDSAPIYPISRNTTEP